MYKMWYPGPWKMLDATQHPYQYNHRKDVKSIKAIPICKHFNNTNHSFNDDAIFTIIEQLKNIRESRAILTERLNKREDF